jgi:iron complex transport system substrate-binding protein
MVRRAREASLRLVTAPLRIVSLLPSATEIAVALGLGDQLVGRSHECDYPPGVERLPVCTSSKLAPGLGSLEIDLRVREIVRQGLSVYEVDADLLRALRPDVILTQSQCAVCAVTPRDLEEALASWIGEPPLLLSLAPEDLSDIWKDVLRVGEATGTAACADRLVETLKHRLQAIGRRAPADAPRPRVAAIEWIEPLMAAGNWVPELVSIAGGEPLFMAPGQHSEALGLQELIEADPDLIVFMPCGYRISQTMAELGALLARPEWAGLRAVRAGRVFAADGHHFFNRPGPRIVESAQIVAALLAADDKADGHIGEGWIRAGRPSEAMAADCGGSPGA